VPSICAACIGRLPSFRSSDRLGTLGLPPRYTGLADVLLGDLRYFSKVSFFVSP